jgi:hypothetical protein
LKARKGSPLGGREIEVGASWLDASMRPLTSERMVPIWGVLSVGGVALVRCSNVQSMPRREQFRHGSSSSH